MVLVVREDIAYRSWNVISFLEKPFSKWTEITRLLLVDSLSRFLQILYYV